MEVYRGRNPLEEFAAQVSEPRLVVVVVVVVQLAAPRGGPVGMPVSRRMSAAFLQQASVFCSYLSILVFRFLLWEHRDFWLLQHREQCCTLWSTFWWFTACRRCVVDWGVSDYLVRLL